MTNYDEIYAEGYAEGIAENQKYVDELKEELAVYKEADALMTEELEDKEELALAHYDAWKIREEKLKEEISDLYGQVDCEQEEYSTLSKSYEASEEEIVKLKKEIQEMQDEKDELNDINMDKEDFEEMCEVLELHNGSSNNVVYYDEGEGYATNILNMIKNIEKLDLENKKLKKELKSQSYNLKHFRSKWTLDSIEQKEYIKKLKEQHTTSYDILVKFVEENLEDAVVCDCDKWGLFFDWGSSYCPECEKEKEDENDTECPKCGFLWNFEECKECGNCDDDDDDDDDDYVCEKCEAEEQDKSVKQSERRQIEGIVIDDEKEDPKKICREIIEAIVDDVLA